MSERRPRDLRREKGAFFALPLLLVLASSAVLATTLIPVKATCPVCGFVFEAWKVGSTNNFGGVDSDFCQHARGTAPLPYYVWTCPSCCYSAYSSGFAELDEDMKKKILKELKSPVPITKDMSQHHIPGWAKYDLAATVARWKGAGAEELAWYYLRASWAVRQGTPGAPEGLGGDESLQKAREAVFERARVLMGEGPRLQNERNTDVKMAGLLLSELQAGKVPEEERGVQELVAAGIYRSRGENVVAARICGRLRSATEPPEAIKEAAGRALDSISAERAFQREALILLDGALEKGAVAGENRASCMYLVGELHRRLGEPEKAAARYRKALACEERPEWLDGLAEAMVKDLDGAPLMPEGK